MFHKINFHIILLTLILVLGFGLRAYRITEIPSGFFADEASIGYNAYTILTKGADEYGTPFPLFFKAFGEYKSPVQIYATVPFVALFGLNEFSVRLPPAIFGTLTILTIYFLTIELLKNHNSKHIIALSGDATHGEVVNTGSLDRFEPRRLVIHHVEGGEEAFERKKTKYALSPA